MASNVGLPEGFEVEYSPSGLPEGFEVVNEPSIKKPLWKMSNQELNDNLKAQYQEKLEKRNAWEQSHPIISRLQADYQPNYRASKLDWEEKAKYGVYAPLNVKVGNDLKKQGLNAVPAINWGVSLLTKKPTGGVLSALKTGAIEGAKQGFVSEALDEIATNGLTDKVITRGVGGGVGGALAGGVTATAAPLTKNVGLSVAGLQPKNYERLVSPKSKALELSDEAAEMLALDTTERFRKGYSDLVEKRGKEVQDAIKNLKGFDQRFDLGDLERDITSTFDQYQLDQSNRMRELTGGLEKDLIESINKKSLPFPDIDPNSPILKNIDPKMVNSVSPLSLEGEKLKLGKMINWDDKKAAAKNEVLEQIYGKYNNRLSELSPELAQANANYSLLADYAGKNSRLRSILNPNLDIDTSKKKLLNYKSTDNNIKDLEKMLIAEGYEPFLSDIDDAIAAKELLESVKTGRNAFGLVDLFKKGLTPILSTQKALNTKAPWLLPVTEDVRRLLLAPVVNKGINPIIQGAVQ